MTDLYIMHSDIVPVLQALEPKLPLIYRKDIRDAIQEIVSLRAKLEAALANNRDPHVHSFQPDYPERQ